MAFDPDKYLAKKSGQVGGSGGFDPDAYLKKKGVPTVDGSDTVKAGLSVDQASAEAALQGFGEQASFGLLPKLQAAASVAMQKGEKVLGKLGIGPGATDEELKAQGVKIEGRESDFQTELESFRGRSKQLRAESPKAFMAGEIGGVLGSGAAAAKAAGLAARAVGAVAPKAIAAFTPVGKVGQFSQGAAKLAASGAAQGFIQSDPLKDIDLSDRAKNAFNSALASVAIGGAAKAASIGVKSLKNLPSGLRKEADFMAVRAAGAKQSLLKKISKKGADFGRVREVGRELIEDGIVEAGDNIEKISEKLTARLSEKGQVIGGIYKGVDELVADPKFQSALSSTEKKLLQDTAVNPSSLKNSILQKVKDRFLGTPYGRQVLKQAEGVLENLDDVPAGKSSSVVKLQEFRRGVDKTIRYDLPPQEAKAAQSMLKMIRSEIKNSVDSHIDAIDKVFARSERLPVSFGVRGGVGNATKQVKLLEELKKANRSYSLLSDADILVRDRLNTQRGNLPIGLIETIGGVGLGASQGDTVEEAAIKGLAGAFAIKGVRRYGPAIGAKVFDAAAKTAAPIGKAGASAAGVLEFLSKPSFSGAIGARANKREKALEGR